MTTQQHFSRTFTLAFPVILSQLGQVFVGVADSVMVGQLGALPLAAASLANSIFFVLMMFGMGVSMGVTPLVSAADGNGRIIRIGKLFRHGLWINIFTACLLSGVIYGVSRLLESLGQPLEVVTASLPYLMIITASLVPYMIFQTFKQFAEGLSQTKQAMLITIFSNVVNVFLNWVLIFGHLGFPAMGLLGAGWATLISRVMMAFLMGGYVLFSGRYARYALRVSPARLSIPMLSKILTIGLPTGFQFIFEVSAFGSATIMMGWLGVNALASHQIALNLASISYMMAAGLGTAGMIRVSNQIGKNDFKSMREAGWVAVMMVLVLMSISAVIFIGFRMSLPGLYVDDPEVIQLAASLLVIAGMFQLSDGVQVVGLGILRGMEDVKFPTLLTFIAYWVVGLPLGYVLAFELNWGEQGIWYGLLIGLTLTASLLVVRFYRLSKNFRAGR